MPHDPVIDEWAASPAATRQIAAHLAGDLAAASRNDPVDSTQAIATRFSVSRSVAVNARNLLIGRGLIHKHGRRYYAA